VPLREMYWWCDSKEGLLLWSDTWQGFPKCSIITTSDAASPHLINHHSSSGCMIATEIYQTFIFGSCRGNKMTLWSCALGLDTKNLGMVGQNIRGESRCERGSIRESSQSLLTALNNKPIASKVFSVWPEIDLGFDKLRLVHRKVSSGGRRN
jgi:hypothetical protein